MRYVRHALAAVAITFSLPTGAQPAAPALTVERQRAIVGAAAAAYADGYVYRDRGNAIAEALRRQAARGDYDRPLRPAAFATALTRAIRAVQPDRHIEILAPAPGAAPAVADAPRTRVERLGWIARLRRRNYDFVRVERLPGNVGYLRLDTFPPPELAEATAAAAMAFLAHSDAVIVDLRENGGGTNDMVRFLASYFFAEPTRLSRILNRARDPQLSIESTLTSVPGERMPIVDLFILTSAKTISAAEAFAFPLQQLGRAVVVGEVTAGAANGGEYIDLGDGFRAFVPDVHVYSPIDETSWEGRGVQPDIAAPAAQALAVAHREALRRLLASAKDTSARETLQGALEASPR